MNDFDYAVTEPSAADLAAIETEGPLIDAELAWLAAEEAFGDAIEADTVSDLDWQRLRSRERAVIRETLAYVAIRLRRSPALPSAA
jgi:hypothetical protein